MEKDRLTFINKLKCILCMSPSDYSEDQCSYAFNHILLLYDSCMDMNTSNMEEDKKDILIYNVINEIYLAISDRFKQCQLVLENTKLSNKVSYQYVGRIYSGRIFFNAKEDINRRINYEISEISKMVSPIDVENDTINNIITMINKMNNIS